MTREEKNIEIDQLNVQLSENKNFYLTDISGLTAQSNSDLRRLCFKQEVKIQVIKNTLLKKDLQLKIILSTILKNQLTIGNLIYRIFNTKRILHL